MRNLTLTFTLFISSFSFAQYIENATIKIKDKDITIEAKDIVYLDEKNIQFRNIQSPYVLSNLKVKHIEKIDFDPTQYKAEIPELNETFSPKREGRGVYLTIEDALQNNITEKKFKIRKVGKAWYEFDADLIDVVDNENKKLKDIAGILFNGDLYLSVKYISKNESKEEKGSYVLQHPANTFVRVKYIGEDFLYLEIPLQTMGNLIASTSLGMGGLIGGALAGILSVSEPNNYRPIIMYNNEGTFHTFKNCINFNEHFEKRNPNMKIDCENNYNLNNIREKIITEL